MHALQSYLPEQSISKINSWIKELGVSIKVTKPRTTKLGDFKVVDGRLFISINNNLNPYSFLITLTHELAHAFVHQNYKQKLKPHGEEWQNTFKGMMLNFLSPNIFPDDVLKVLSTHIIKPNASSSTDTALASVLRKYNETQNLTLEELEIGTVFKVNGKIFKKGEQLRKRFKCIEVTTNKVYLVHPLAEVKC